MNRITENTIEKLVIKLLEKQGYQHVYTSVIPPDSDTPERNRFEDVLLLENLQSPVGRITTSKAKTIDVKYDQGINNKQICTLEKFRDTLLPKLMSGEVRVAV